MASTKQQTDSLDFSTLSGTPNWPEINNKNLLVFKSNQKKTKIVQMATGFLLAAASHSQKIKKYNKN